MLNRLWKLVNDRLNYLTPTKKPIGYGQTRDGRRTPPLRQAHRPRWTASWPPGSLSPAQEPELIAYRDSLNPAAIAREIADLQTVLLTLAKDKTEQLYLASHPDRPTRRPQRHPDQGRLTPVSRAFLREASISFRGHLDLRHYA